MGRYSSESDEEYRRSKKKKKRRSRSRSRSADSSSRKHKKSKKKAKKRSRSRSASSDRYNRRRSRSRDRRSRSRSYTRPRGGRSRSRSTSRSQQYSRSRRRSGSRSRRSSRSRRYSRSNSSSPGGRSSTKGRSKNTSRERDVKIKTEIKEEVPEKEDPCKSIPGFENMSLSEQNAIRMQLALKAAAATDERLRKEGLLPSNVGRASKKDIEDQANRVQVIEDIEGDAFTQQTFTSSRGEQNMVQQSSSSSDMSMTATHENAMFSNAPIKFEPGLKGKTIVYKDASALLHPVFFEDAKVKMDRWMKKLTAMRRKKLEGEAMS